MTDTGLNKEYSERYWVQSWGIIGDERKMV